MVLPLDVGEKTVAVVASHVPFWHKDGRGSPLLPRHQWPDDYSFLSVETSLRAILTYKNEGSEREVVSVLASRSMGSYGLSVCRCNIFADNCQ